MLLDGSDQSTSCFAQALLCQIAGRPGLRRASCRKRICTQRLINNNNIDTPRTPDTSTITTPTTNTNRSTTTSSDQVELRDMTYDRP